MGTSTKGYNNMDKVKKKDILSILSTEFIEKEKRKQEIFNSCLSDEEFEMCVNEYFIPYMKDNQNLYDFGFNFDPFSDNPKDEMKSMLLVKRCINTFAKSVATLPDLFMQYKKMSGIKIAVINYLHEVLRTNISYDKKYINDYVENYFEEKK